MEVEVRYMTEFGSTATTMDIEKLPSFTKKFKISSVKPIIDFYTKKDMKRAFDVGFQVGYNDEESPSYLTFDDWIVDYEKKETI